MLQELSIDGRAVSLSSIGVGAPIVCLPGGPGFPGEHLGDLGGLSRERTLLRVNWRGAGASAEPADGLHAVADYAADLALIQDSLGLEAAVLFGHSFGGLVAATYSAQRPSRVSDLILDATPSRLNEGRAPVGGMAGYFANFDGAAERYLERLMASLFEPAATWFQANELSTFDLTPCLGAITARTLVITGDRDWAAGRALAEDMASMIPDAELAVIPGAGHFAWVEQPELYAARVLAFLKEDHRHSG